MVIMGIQIQTRIGPIYTLSRNNCLQRGQKELVKKSLNKTSKNQWLINQLNISMKGKTVMTRDKQVCKIIIQNKHTLNKESNDVFLTTNWNINKPQQFTEQAIAEKSTTTG